MKDAILTALLVYGIAAVISFFVAVLIKVIFVSIKLFEGNKE